jgi:hypothetical protein
MQKQSRQPINKSTIFKIVLIFAVSYFFALMLWIQIKAGYCYMTALMTSKLVAGIKNAKVEDIEVVKGAVEVTFRPIQQATQSFVRVQIQTNYTFNAPLTIAIMASLFLFIKRRKRAYAEALCILLSVHLLYVFSLEMTHVTDAFMKSGIEKINKPVAYFYQFLWVFTRSMIIRFEPFLIGFYIYMRFAPRSPDKPAA